jgi:hypothetical protein
MGGTTAALCSQVVFRSGAVYEGEHRNGKCDGFGTYRFANGDVYVTALEPRQVCRIGIAGADVVTQCRYRYEGEFRAGKRDGFGTMRYCQRSIA